MNIKSLFLFASILLSVSAYAQKGELNKGKTSYSKFNEVKLMGKPELGMKDLEAARTALEKASLHEKTSGLSETWTYLALAYTDYAMMDTTGANPELKEKAIAAIAKAKAGEGNEAQADTIGAYLEEKKNTLRFAHWFFGKFHVTKRIPTRFTAVFDTVIDAEILK